MILAKHKPGLHIVGSAEVGPKPQSTVWLCHLHKAHALGLVLEQIRQGKHQGLLRQARGFHDTFIEITVNLIVLRHKQCINILSDNLSYANITM